MMLVMTPSVTLIIIQPMLLRDSISLLFLIRRGNILTDYSLPSDSFIDIKDLGITINTTLPDNNFLKMKLSQFR